MGTFWAIRKSSLLQNIEKLDIKKIQKSRTGLKKIQRVPIVSFGVVSYVRKGVCGVCKRGYPLHSLRGVSGCLSCSSVVL